MTSRMIYWWDPNEYRLVWESFLGIKQASCCMGGVWGRHGCALGLSLGISMVQAYASTYPFGICAHGSNLYLKLITEMIIYCWCSWNKLQRHFHCISRTSCCSSSNSICGYFLFEYGLCGQCLYGSFLLRIRLLELYAWILSMWIVAFETLCSCLLCLDFVCFVFVFVDFLSRLSV